MMRILDLGARPEVLADALLEALAFGVAVVPMARVYTIVASPTFSGAALLDRTKARRSGKYYTTSVAQKGRLSKIVDPGALDPAWIASLDQLQGALLRLPMAPTHVNTPAICQGMHQSLLLPAPLREAFCLVEQELSSMFDRELFYGKPCLSVLSTSCNVSGDPEGTIVDPAKALAFSRERSVALHIDGPIEQGPGFPIVELRGKTWRVCREGGLDAFMSSLPTGVERVE